MAKVASNPSVVTARIGDEALTRIADSGQFLSKLNTASHKVHGMESFETNATSSASHFAGSL